MSAASEVTGAAATALNGQTTADGGTPPPAPAENGAAAAPEPNPWQGLEGEDLGLVQNKGWKGLPDAIKSYRNLERLRGVPENELIRVPGDDAPPEAWEAIYSKLGRPADVDGYGEPPPEGGIDLRPLAHKHGLTPRQAKGILQDLQELTGSLQTQTEEQRATANEQELKALERDWGQEYAKNVALGQRAVQALRWDEQTLEKLENAMGARWLFEFTHRIGQGLGDHGGLPGEAAGGSFMQTREGAQARYQSMNADPEFQAKLASPDRNVRMQAAAERARVREMGWPDE